MGEPGTIVSASFSAARAHAKVLRSVKTSGVRGMLTGLKRYVEGSDWKHRSVLLQGQ